MTETQAEQVAETAAQTAEQARKLAEAAGAPSARTGGGDLPEDPTPEAILRRSRQRVDEALSSVASVDVEMAGADRRVSELEAGLDPGRQARARVGPARCLRGERRGSQGRPPASASPAGLAAR